MRQHGFTLVELLSVIVIIAALFGLLVPSLQNSRRQAKAAVCMSNLRQINSAFSIYLNDNGSFPYGFFSTSLAPPDGDFITHGPYDRPGWWWFNFLRGIYKKSMGNKTIIQCPAKQLNQLGLKNVVLSGNYGMNLSLGRMSVGYQKFNEFRGKPRALSEVLHPAQTMLIVDSGYAIINWYQAADISPVMLDTTDSTNNLENTAYIPGLSINRQRDLWADQKIDAINGRHSQKTVNAGFVDGHVARMKAEEFLVKKIADANNYVNKTPLWEPAAK
jgi:prepilin-type N-terminal cleavage/methylation domain-containing protein/prepilin-type processing-associated H-X9-DG protein